MLWSDVNNPREDSVFLRVKAAARRGGGPGSVVGVLRQFRELEDEVKRRGEKGVSHKIFIDFLQDFGFCFREGEAEYLCTAFDDSRDGYITSSTFVRHFTGLNARRHKAIMRAWEMMPKNERGEVALDHLHERYARGGSRTDFSATFTAPPHQQDDGDGRGASWEEFVAFYAAVSPEFGMDEAFETYMLREWDADVPVRPTMNETQREWGPEGDPLSVTRSLLVQDALNMTLGTTSRSYNFSHMRRVHPHVEPLPPLERDYLSVTKRDFSRITREERVTANTLRHR